MPALPKGYKKCRKNRATGLIVPSKRGYPDNKNWIYGYSDPRGDFYEGKFSPSRTVSAARLKDKKVKLRIRTYVAEVDKATAEKWREHSVRSDSDVAKTLVDTIDRVIKDRENSLRVRLRLEMLDALNAALSKVFGGDVNQEVKPV